MATTPPVGAPLTSEPDPVIGQQPTAAEIREESYRRLGLFTGDESEIAEPTPAVSIPVEQPVATPSPAVAQSPAATTTTTSEVAA